MTRSLLLAFSALALFSLNAAAQNIRAGIIGLDTSHVLAFTKTLNATPQKPEVMGVRVVAAYPQGSKDIESSTKRVPEYVEKVKELITASTAKPDFGIFGDTGVNVLKLNLALDTLK